MQREKKNKILKLNTLKDRKKNNFIILDKYLQEPCPLKITHGTLYMEGHLKFFRIVFTLSKMQKFCSVEY